MIGLGFYNVTQTTTDLNGPFLRFTTEPETSTTVDDGGSVTLTGIATAEFKHNPTIPGERVTNTGEIEYQWYIDGTAAQDITDKISGSQTNEITLSNLSNPTETGRSIVLRATYTGSAYQSEEGAVTAGIAASTGNGANEPLDAPAAVVIVNPTITIDTQPEDATAAQAVDATFTVAASASDDSDVTYQWNQDGNPLSDNDDVSGANTPTLTITSREVGTSTITVTVSHPTAGNSPVTSDGATFTVVSARTILQYYFHDDSGNYYGSGSKDLFEGPLSLTANPNRATQAVSIHTPEKDITVKVDMGAAAGANRNGNNGGEGGISSFNMTFERNQEYILKLGSQVQPTGGANGGGGAAYIYKKGRLIAVIGGGGAAGNVGRGGDGGGIGVAGGNGGGRGGGQGGETYATGILPTTGVFPGGQVTGGVNWSAPDAGRVSGCPMGSDYFRSRYSPCDDIGNDRYRTGSGSAISQTPIITRGFKPGIGHRNNGGNGSGGNGGGGSGAHGGDAGSQDSAGGGGSGYTSGDVEVLTTQRGGNASVNAFATFTYIEPD